MEGSYIKQASDFSKFPRIKLGLVQLYKIRFCLDYNSDFERPRVNTARALNKKQGCFCPYLTERKQCTPVLGQIVNLHVISRTLSSKEKRKVGKLC